MKRPLLTVEGFGYSIPLGLKGFLGVRVRVISSGTQKIDTSRHVADSYVLWKMRLSEHCTSLRKWSRKHREMFYQIESIARTIIFWIPVNVTDESKANIQEILWGTLELVRLAFDAAADTIPEEQGFGTTIAIKPSYLPGNAWRISISILQCVWPIAQELVRDSSNGQRTFERQAKARLLLERIRVVLRLGLLSSYWMSMAQTKTIRPGILTMGGAYFASIRAPTIEEEETRSARFSYVGKRTGRKLRSGVTFNQSLLNAARMAAGEVLYILRPLVTAGTDCIQGHGKYSKWKAWFVCLFMDILSLENLHHVNVSGNSVTRAELSRRKARLLLYLLRTPIWEYGSRPMLENTSLALQKIPLLGRLATAYLWDYIMYWKLYGAETG